MRKCHNHAEAGGRRCDTYSNADAFVQNATPIFLQQTNFLLGVCTNTLQTVCKKKSALGNKELLNSGMESGL